MKTYYDSNGYIMIAANPKNAACILWGNGNHDGKEFYSYSVDGWIKHVLGSGGADILITDGDLPFVVK